MHLSHPQVNPPQPAAAKVLGAPRRISTPPPSRAVRVPRVPRPWRAAAVGGAAESAGGRRGAGLRRATADVRGDHERRGRLWGSNFRGFPGQVPGGETSICGSELGLEKFRGVCVWFGGGGQGSKCLRLRVQSLGGGGFETPLRGLTQHHGRNVQAELSFIVFDVRE